MLFFSINVLMFSSWFKDFTFYLFWNMRKKLSQNWNHNKHLRLSIVKCQFFVKKRNQKRAQEKNVQNSIDLYFISMYFLRTVYPYSNCNLIIQSLWINSLENYFDQCSWGLERNCVFFLLIANFGTCLIFFLPQTSNTATPL